MIYFYLSNPMLSDRLSDDNFNKLSTSHIGSLKVYETKPGDTLFGVAAATIVNSLVADTESAYNDWRASANSQSTQKSMKEGKTISVDDSMEAIKSFISRKAGVIADKFPKGSPVYEEFFPLGLTEYSLLSKKNADTILKRFINALDAHKGDFDAAMLTEANEMYSTYLGLRNDQLQTMGKVKDGATDSGEKRRRLAVQLYRNLLTLLLLNVEEPEKAANYFDESIIRKKSGNDQPPAPPQNP